MQGFNQFNFIQDSQAKPSSDDNMIPLINIVFLLLIFFMVAGQIKAQPDQAITLPSTAQLESAQAQTLRLELFADGQLMLNGELIEVASLKSKIDLESAGSIALFADARVTAKQLDELLSEFANTPQWSIELYTLEK
ncbi:MAG: biopolymer transporter ExbD [Bermanella sp.]|nr:biopolymer transporter ExbD [Bermanella sp.]